MDRKQVWKLHRAGVSAAHIAPRVSSTKSEVQALIGEMETQHTKVRLLKTALWIAGIVAVVSGFVLLANNFPSNDSKLSVVARSSINPADQYLAGRIDDQWLLNESDLDIDRSKNGQYLANLAADYNDKVQSCFKKYESLDGVRELRPLFANKTYVSFFSPQHGGSSVAIATNVDELEKHNSQREIVLFSKQDLSHSRIHDHLLFYDPEWKSLMVGAVKFDPSWFDAIVLHELCHARADAEGAPSSHAAYMSDLWISEEIAAHQLERAVLNAATNDSYNCMINQIVMVKDVESLEAFHSSLTVEDYHKIDSLFYQAGMREAGTRIAQYQIDLGEAWLVSRSGVVLQMDNPSMRLKNYRLMVASQE